MSAGSISFGVVTSRMSLVHSTLFTPATASSSLLRASVSAVDIFSTVIMEVEAMLKSSSRYPSPTMESNSGGR